MIEQSYGRLTRMNFLGPLIGARSESLINAAVGWRPDPPKGFKKTPNFLPELWWRRGKSKIRYREYSVRKRRIPAALSNECILQSTGTYRLLSLGTVIFHLDIGGIARQRNQICTVLNVCSRRCGRRKTYHVVMPVSLLGLSGEHSQPGGLFACVNSRRVRVN